MPPDPLTCVSHSLNAKYHYSSGILQGVQLTYFGNTPAIQNSTPFKNVWARACQDLTSINLTSNVNPRTERIKKCIMTVDP